VSAVILAFPDPRDPVGAIRRTEAVTGLVAKPRGAIVVLEPAKPHSNIAPFRPLRDFIPAFLRQRAPVLPTDPDGPKAA
jgi:hypothetical protein